VLIGRYGVSSNSSASKIGCQLFAAYENLS
jgi:hypothetical protein